jgi:UDP-N-acetylmuramyl pentapeptide phosphotransferase/UDP-N-acetylglucosamine-1-phosphate transferase
MAGLIEDVTHKVGPTPRLVMATVSALMLHNILGVSITRTDVVFIDWIFSIPGGQLLITLLVVAGFTHSVNIIDGFHGLSCGLMIIALLAISFMAWKVGDLLILQISMTSIFIFIGFFIFNWPKGNIFLGDAGAYLIGFWVVELGILFAIRNPVVSPMAPVVAGLLPLIETLFSMYRRRVVRKLPVNNPDALHLHTLVFRRLLYKSRAKLSSNESNRINGKVAIYFWAPAFLFASLGCIYMTSTLVQMILIACYTMMYLWLYRRLVVFKAPNILKIS